MKKITKRLFTWISISSLIAGGVTALAFSFNNTSSQNDIKTLVNLENRSIWFKFDQSSIYGGHSSNELVSGALPTAIGLMSYKTSGENVEIFDGYDKNFQIKYKKSPRAYSQSYRLDLAEKIYVDNQEFTQEKINSNPREFEKALSDGKESIKFKLRKNVPWIDHNGQIVVSPITKKPYYLEAKDFVYGMYRMVTSNNIRRNSPFNEENIFGAFGQKRANQSLEDWKKYANDYNSQLISMTGLPTLSGARGYSNEYLFDIYGLQNPLELLKKEGNKERLMYYSDEIIFKKSPEATEEEVNFKSFVDKNIINSYEIAPAPSKFIEEVSSKIETIQGGGRTLEVPSKYKNSEWIADDQINFRKFALFTYGTHLTNTLHLGPFYASEDSRTKTKYVKNKHFFDQEWVKDPSSINSYTIEYSPSKDGKIFAQSNYNQYINGKTFNLPLNDLEKSKLKAIRENPEKSGLRFKEPLNKDNFVNNIFPVILPSYNQDKYLFNDEFARLWFGSSLSRIKSGKMEIGDYLSPSAIAFRSQINAAINWYGLNRTLSPNEETEIWLGQLPPDVPFSSTNKDTLYNHKEKINSLYWYELNAQGELERKESSLSKNIEHYQKSSNQKEAIKSKDFEAISKNIRFIIDYVLGKNFNNIEFEYVNSELNTNSLAIKVQEEIQGIIQQLNNKIKPKYSIINDPGILNSILGRNESLGTMHGWGADYDGIGTWISGWSRNRFGFQATALAMNAKVKDPEFRQRENYKILFANIINYGNELAQYLESKKDSLINSFVTTGKITDKEMLNKYYISFDLAHKVTNFGDKSLGSSMLLSNFLFNEKAFINEKNNHVKNAIKEIENKSSSWLFIFDLSYTSNDKFEVEMIRETISIFGTYFSGRSFSIKNKSRKEMVLWQRWLELPIQSNGLKSFRNARIRS